MVVVLNTACPIFFARSVYEQLFGQGLKGWVHQFSSRGPYPLSRPFSLFARVRWLRQARDLVIWDPLIKTNLHDPWWELVNSPFKSKVNRSVTPAAWPRISILLKKVNIAVLIFCTWKKLYVVSVLWWLLHFLSLFFFFFLLSHTAAAPLELDVIGKLLLV